jgi:hypothetical protein
MTDLTRRSTPLYELSDQYLAVLELLELDSIDDDAGQLELALDSIAARITDKAEGIVGLVKQFEGMAELRAAEAKRMKALADADQKRADRLRDYLLRHLVEIGTEKIDTARFRISVRQNPPSVQVVDEAQIPEEYLRTVTTVSVDKRGILDALKATGEIPSGVEIIHGTRLDVR